MKSNILRILIFIMLSQGAFASSWTSKSRWNSHRGFSAAASISAGGSHSMGIQKGKPWAWGANSFDQLGDNSALDRNFPVVSRPILDIIMVSAGENHSLALRSDGIVWSWGDGLNGQLGDGFNNGQKLATQVLGLDSIVAVSAGGKHSMALTVSGRVYVWGDNAFGQLGDGNSPTPSNTAILVSSLNNVVAISAGKNHCMALQSNGIVVAWGDNSFGQIGNGATGLQTTPTIISSSNVVAISAGSDGSYLINANGTVMAWGENGSGQLGIGSNTDQLSPTLIPSFMNVESIDAGNSFVIARKADGTLWAWGKNDVNQLGNGNTTNQTSPLQITTTNKVVAISAGGNHCLAIDGAGKVLSWGKNLSGQLGDTSNIQRSTPVSSNFDVIGIVMSATGGEHSLILKANGLVFSWGKNNKGQLGDGSGISTNSSNLVPLLSQITKVGAGEGFSVALKADGTVWTWGGNNFGQIGNGTNGTDSIPNPTQVSALSNIIDISVGVDFVMALEADGTIWVWGNNTDGVQGNGTFNTLVNTPTKIAGTTISNVIGISAGYYFALALTADGKVWSWGGNSQPNPLHKGMLGNGTIIDNYTPTPIASLSNAIDISSGDYHSKALMVNGTTMGWGTSSLGELGDSAVSTPYSTIPVKSNIVGIKELSCGFSFTKYLRFDGTLFASGLNSDGAQADESTIGVHSLNPSLCYITTLSTILDNGISISAGRGHAIVVLSDLSIAVAGKNLNGQLGTGDNTQSKIYLATSNINCDVLPTTAVIDSTTINNCGINQIITANTFSDETAEWNILSGNGFFVGTATSNFVFVDGLSLGENKIEYTISKDACPVSRDTVTVINRDNPADAGILADTICISDGSFTLNANSPTAGGNGYWTNFGSSSFDNPNDPNTTLTKATGQTSFTWHIKEIGCVESDDIIYIQVLSLPTTSAISTIDFTICQSGTSPIGANTPSEGIGTWSSPTGATFTSSTSPSTDVNNLIVGVNKMYWNISNGFCPVSKDSLFITGVSNPFTPDAGADSSYCFGVTKTMNGSDPLTFSGKWNVISGSASFTNNTLYNTSVSSLAVGTNKLEWEVSNSICTLSDTVLIKIDAQPTTANAGGTADTDTMCYDGIDFTLKGNNPSGGVGKWINLTPFASNIAVESAYNSPMTITGAYPANLEFIWTISSGVCASSRDTVRYYAVENPPVAFAGVDVPSICKFPFALNGNAPATGSGKWTVKNDGSSAGIFSPSDQNNNADVSGLNVGANTFVWSIESFGACKTSDEVIVIYEPALPFVIAKNTDTTELAVVGASTYQWYKDGVAISGATSPSHMVTSCGLYHFEGLTTLGCFIGSDTISVKCGVGITENNLLNATQIFPNPTEGLVNILIDKNVSDKVSFVLFNAIGEMVLNDEIVNYNYNLDLSEYERGLYYLKIFDGKQTSTKKIVKM